jgi:predicted DCC family thiol-disulfide oxidoreductase YuxK
MALKDSDSSSANAIPSGKLVVFYDGLCGFCDQTVQFILERDRGRDQFRFAPLQSSFAEEILPKHGKDPKNLNSLYLLVDPGLPTETVYQKSEATRRIALALGGSRKMLAALIGLFPLGIRDWGYDRIANIRYRIFGKRDSCRLPSKEDRAKFVGI